MKTKSLLVDEIIRLKNSGCSNVYISNKLGVSKDVIREIVRSQ